MARLRAVIPKGSFAAAGGVLGSAFGAGGSALGTAAGQLLSRITGMGDYKINNLSVRSNSFLTRGLQPPVFGSGTALTRICYREYLGDVVTSATPGAFQIASYPLNPGQSATFPWLSTMAALFQEYRLVGMVFEYKTTSGPIGNLGGSGSTALGAVIMATQYNAYDAPFANKQAMEEEEFAVSVVPSASQLHMIECAPNQTPFVEKYVRTGAPVGDLRMSDLGTFSIATSGCPFPSNAVGELWVSYDVELYKPRLGVAASSVLAGGIITTTAIAGDPYSVVIFQALSAGMAASAAANAVTITGLIIGGHYMWGTGENGPLGTHNGFTDANAFTITGGTLGFCSCAGITTTAGSATAWCVFQATATTVTVIATTALATTYFSSTGAVTSYIAQYA